MHYGGRPIDVRRLKQVVGDRVTIIEDCAHACGASYYGQKVGSEGNISCFSFHAVKNLAMGDGGALVTHREKDWDRAKRLRPRGRQPGALREEGEEGECASRAPRIGGAHARARRRSSK